MSICDKCIHDEVCGLEDNHEEGIVSCADMIPKDVFGKIKIEIEKEKHIGFTSQDFADGLDMALEIINKHIKNEVNHEIDN